VIPGARPDPVCWPGADVARAAAQVNHLYGQASGQTRQLEDMLASLQRVSQQMDSQWRMQVVRTSTSKSDVWKRRVEQVAEETDALKAALDKHTHRERRCARGEPHAPASAPAAQSGGSSAHCAACSQRHCARCSHKQTPPPESCRLPGPALCRMGGSVGDQLAEEQQRERQRQRRGPAEALSLPPAAHVPQGMAGHAHEAASARAGGRWRTRSGRSCSRAAQARATRPRGGATRTRTRRPPALWTAAGARWRRRSRPARRRWPAWPASASGSRRAPGRRMRRVALGRSSARRRRLVCFLALVLVRLTGAPRARVAVCVRAVGPAQGARRAQQHRPVGLGAAPDRPAPAVGQAARVRRHGGHAAGPGAAVVVAARAPPLTRSRGTMLRRAPAALLPPVGQPSAGRPRLCKGPCLLAAMQRGYLRLRSAVQAFAVLQPADSYTLRLSGSGFTAAVRSIVLSFRLPKAQLPPKPALQAQDILAR